MKYKKGHFYIENVSAEKIAKSFGTPSYVYSSEKIKNNINNFKKNFKTINPLICFSVKSNSNLKILNLICKLGLGADVVSKGELIRALKAKIKPEKIVFSGVGKTIDELKFAINKKILLINTESENEIIEIEKIAKKNKSIVNIGLRFNPDTDANTLKNISTGKKENKFGLTKKSFLKILKIVSAEAFAAELSGYSLTTLSKIATARSLLPCSKYIVPSLNFARGTFQCVGYRPTKVL